jgi:thiamine biosynthesis lipoprotein
VEPLLGTAVRVDIPGEPPPGGLLDEVFAWFRWVEQTFSVFLPQSEVSRLGRGDLALDDAHPLVREVVRRCEDLTERTDGAFSHRPGRPERPLDLNGLVKGWSVDEAARMLRMSGLDRFCVDAGGDLWCQGARQPGRGWRVGIRHPDDPGRHAAVLEIANGAVATSGRSERGEHIWGGAGPRRLRTVTVVGADVGLADALATALLAADEVTPDWLARFPGWEIFAVTTAGTTLWTPGLDALLR